MKKLALLSLTALLAFAVRAQYTSPSRPTSTYSTNTASTDKGFIWSIGVEPSVPIGKFHTYSNFGLGGSLQGEYKPGRAGITLNLGYLDYFGKTNNGISYSDFKYWPLLGGLKYYLGNSYLHGQAGPGFGTNGLGTSFWYGAGYGINLSKAVDAEVKYAGWHQKVLPNSSSSGTGSYGTGGGTTGSGTGGGYGGHYSTIGLRLAYNF